MARNSDAPPADAGDAPARVEVPEGAVVLARNHGAIVGSRHRFWAAGTVLTDPAEIAVAARTGAMFAQ